MPLEISDGLRKVEYSRCGVMWKEEELNARLVQGTCRFVPVDSRVHTGTYRYKRHSIVYQCIRLGHFQ